MSEHSVVVAAIHEPKIPPAKTGLARRTVEPSFALNGGDDYDLLFAARPRTSVPCNIVGVPVTQIGRITRQKQMRLVLGDGSVTELKPRGWEHFGRASTR